jgi:hypothetical protein
MSEDDLRPARPAREPGPEATEPADDVDEATALERGRTAALVAALGRVQMSLDLLARKVSRLEEAVRTLSRER